MFFRQHLQASVGRNKQPRRFWVAYELETGTVVRLEELDYDDCPFEEHIELPRLEITAITYTWWANRYKHLLKDL